MLHARPSLRLGRVGRDGDPGVAGGEFVLVGHVEMPFPQRAAVSMDDSDPATLITMSRGGLKLHRSPLHHCDPGSKDAGITATATIIRRTVNRNRGIARPSDQSPSPAISSMLHNLVSIPAAIAGVTINGKFKLTHYRIGKHLLDFSRLLWGLAP